MPIAHAKMSTNDLTNPMNRSSKVWTSNLRIISDSAQDLLMRQTFEAKGLHVDEDSGRGGVSVNTSECIGRRRSVA